MKLMESKKRKEPLRTCLIDVPIPKVKDRVEKVSQPSLTTNVSESRDVVSVRENARSEQTCHPLKDILLEWRTRETVKLVKSFDNAERDVVWLENSTQMIATSDELRRNTIKTWRSAQPSKEALEKEQQAADTKEYDVKVKGFYGGKEQV